MDRQSAQWWLIFVGLVVWAAGLIGLNTFELLSYPWHGADLVRTLGMVTLGAVVAIGAWRMLEKS